MKVISRSIIVSCLLALRIGSWCVAGVRFSLLVPMLLCAVAVFSELNGG